MLSLPPGPIWLLHTFYLLSSALMLLWWWRYRNRPVPPSSSVPAEPARDDDIPVLAAHAASR